MSGETDPECWTNPSPGNLDEELPVLSRGDVERSVSSAVAASAAWRKLSVEDRIVRLEKVRGCLEENAEDLAMLLSRETGKPLRESKGELAAVVGKFALTFGDARRWLVEEVITDGPHPAVVRKHPLGVAAVIAPFNFPLHLGHGAALAYLVAGNPVIFKPSPLAGRVGERYGEILSGGLPEGVFSILQGHGQTAMALCLAPEVRAVHFTGSIAVGRQLAECLASDPSKSLALELGGKNASMVFADADPVAAAAGIAESICLTSGQRCNATARILVEETAEKAFLDQLLEELSRFQPGDPLDPETRLGPLISERAVERFLRFGRELPCDWLLPAESPGRVGNLRGYYVRPALGRITDRAAFSESRLFQEEAFSPLATLEVFREEEEAVMLANATIHGLSASVFTASRERFDRLAESMEVGNLYWNLPTTFSPSTLPFGGWKASGNGMPGARGAVRFATREQAVQFKPTVRDGGDSGSLDSKGKP